MTSRLRIGGAAPATTSAPRNTGAHDSPQEDQHGQPHRTATR